MVFPLSKVDSKSLPNTLLSVLGGKVMFVKFSFVFSRSTDLWKPLNIIFLFQRTRITIMKRNYLRVPKQVDCKNTSLSLYTLRESKTFGCFGLKRSHLGIVRCEVNSEWNQCTNLSRFGFLYLWLLYLFKLFLKKED